MGGERGRQIGMLRTALIVFYESAAGNLAEKFFPD
jgi:hypothetical protein